MKDQNPKVLRARLNRVMADLKAEGAALLLSSPPPIRQSRGTEFPFVQDSDVRYLTGTHGARATLLMVGKTGKSYLFGQEIHPERVVWEGAPPSLKKTAQTLQAELILADTPDDQIVKLLRGTQTLYYQSRAATPSRRVAERLFGLDSYVRGDLPHRFVAADTILAPHRLIKEREEIELIKTAAAITNEGLYTVLEMIRPGTKESEIKEMLEYVFKACGARVAFDTIVAAGKNAAVLHYHGSSARLKSGEFVLIDCGASYQGYAGDISRTIPVGPITNAALSELHQAVLEAQAAAIKTLKTGVSILAPYQAAARALIAALKDLKVLRGTSAQILKKGSFKPFFPHSIGHSLGIDVHDVGEIRGSSSAVLKEGMVLTIEPGIYFAKKTGNIPPCGIRIEDDVLITKRGCEVLSEGFPRSEGELQQALMELA
jgi:Xaa-Pro aminopeptidase